MFSESSNLNLVLTQLTKRKGKNLRGPKKNIKIRWWRTALASISSWAYGWNMSYKQVNKIDTCHHVIHQKNQDELSTKRTQTRKTMENPPNFCLSMMLFPCSSTKGSLADEHRKLHLKMVIFSGRVETKWVSWPKNLGTHGPMVPKTSGKQNDDLLTRFFAGLFQTWLLEGRWITGSSKFIVKKSTGSNSPDFGLSLAKLQNLALATRVYSWVQQRTFWIGPPRNLLGASSAPNFRSSTYTLDHIGPLVRGCHKHNYLIYVDLRFNPPVFMSLRLCMQETIETVCFPQQNCFLFGKNICIITAIRTRRCMI